MLLYSIQLLMACQFLRSAGQIWHHFLCLNFGLIEHIFSFQLIVLMIIPALPLFVDVCFIFMQRVNPPLLFDVIKAKLRKLEETHSFETKQMHLWALDKSFTICQLKIAIENSENDADRIKEVVRRKLQRKWC